MTEAFDFTGSFVELGKSGAQIGWVTTFRWEFGETTRDFSEGFGPTGGGVGKQGNVVTHVSEVLGDGDTGVDGGFTGSDWHVGCVGDENSSVHDGGSGFGNFNLVGTAFDALFNTVNSPFEAAGLALTNLEFDVHFWEFSENFGHFVTSFTATDVDDNFRVGELGDGLGDNGLAATEGAWDGGSGTLSEWEQTVENTLTSDEWVGGW